MTLVQILNLALDKVGITQNQVTAVPVDPTKKEQTAIYRAYEHAARMLLARYDWGFARAQAVLVEFTGAVHPDWSHLYALPADALIIRSISSSRVLTTNRDPFSVEYDSTGVKRIFCDISPVAGKAPVAFYTEDMIGAEMMFPDHFIEALIWRLAADVSLPLRIDPRTAEYARQMAIVSLNTAIGIDIGEGRQDAEPDFDYTKSRE